MTRVVFLIRSLNRGGTERQLATLARSLDKNRFDLTVITFYSGGHFAQEISDNGVPVISLDKKSRWDAIGFLWRLLSQLRRRRPDLIYSFLVEPNLLTALLKPFLPGTKIVWGIRASDMRLEHYDWFARLNFKLQVLGSRFADLIIFNSYAARDYHLAQGFAKRNTAVIHGGIDTEVFKPDRAAGRSVRPEWGIDQDAILIGVVARLDPIKDHPTFIKAAALVAQQRQEAHFVCVGGGEAKYGAELRALTEQLQISRRFTWAGERDDMPVVYNAFDVACCSSLSESLPNSIAEAMACDLPCVVTDVGDAATLVGANGVLVPPGNPQALADGLIKCLDDLQTNEGSSARQRILSEFDVRRLADQTAAALASLMQH